MVADGTAGNADRPTERAGEEWEGSPGSQRVIVQARNRNQLAWGDRATEMDLPPWKKAFFRRPCDEVFVGFRAEAARGGGRSQCVALQVRLRKPAM